MHKVYIVLKQASTDSRIYRPINIFFNNRPSVQAPIFLQKIGLFFKHETRSPRAFSIAHKNILEHKQACILFKTNVLSVGVIQVQITLYNLYNHFNSLGCINQLPFGNQRESRSMSVLNMFFCLFFEMQGHSWNFESVGAKIRKFDIRGPSITT